MKEIERAQAGLQRIAQMMKIQIIGGPQCVRKSPAPLLVIH